MTSLEKQRDRIANAVWDAMQCLMERGIAAERIDLVDATTRTGTISEINWHIAVDERPVYRIHVADMGNRSRLTGRWQPDELIAIGLATMAGQIEAFMQGRVN